MSQSQTAPPAQAKPDARILFQRYFKSVGPRTYAAQVKEASNGNHFLVITEGKRDRTSGEVRKTRLFVFSEDFEPFMKMLTDAAEFIKANPVPREVAQRQQKFWAKRGDGRPGPARPASPPPRRQNRQPMPAR
jgi:hypothetical protein